MATLAAKLEDGSITALNLAEAAIERFKTTEDAMGAYRRWLPDEARALAKQADQAFRSGNRLGGLQGIPVSIKDLYGWDVTDTQAGSPVVLPEKWSQNGPIVTSLLAQSAAINGKTHTVEFAFGGLGVNHRLGTPINPWEADVRQHRVPGGSSSGAGVTLNCGTALLALGTDTGGSVRIPASMTGNVGLKTTAGRWSLRGIVPLSTTLDTPGPLTRTVEDAAWAFASLDTAISDVKTFMQAADNFDVNDLRIARADPALWENLDPGIERVVEDAIAELEAAGAAQQSISMKEVEQVTNIHRQGSVVSAELDEFLSNELPACREQLHPIIASRVHDGGDISAREYLSRKRVLDDVSRSAARYFENFDVIVSPTVAITPPTLKQITAIEDYRSHNFRSLHNTNIGNCLGLCALTIPIGLDACSMPVGLQLMAAANGEEKLLAIGRAVERILGTADKRIGHPPRITAMT